MNRIISIPVTVIIIATSLTFFSCSSDKDDDTPSSSSAGGDQSSSSVEGSSSSVGASSSSSVGGQGSSSSSSFKGYTDIFIDERDNKAYEWVEIGMQTWMAENLNYDVPDNTTDVCFDNNSSTCASQVQLKHRGICPSGWHIPSNEDWDKLSRYADGTSGTSSLYDSPTAGKHLKAKIGWNHNGNGEDTYGFSALPGVFGYSDGDFYDVGYFGRWWSANENYSNYAYSRVMYYYYESAYWGFNLKTYLFSVRCVKN
ncbi:MAG: hypothetical protein FWC26_09630 [Fibromonadales bacterium]|nr:hypothetical protein [Fibromonadales bacterium]